MAKNNGNGALALKMLHDGVSVRETSKRLNVTRETVTRYRKRAIGRQADLPITSPLEKRVLGAVKLLNEKATLEAVCDRLELPPSKVKLAISTLQSSGHTVSLADDGRILRPDVVAPGGRIVHDISKFNNQWYRFGACGDNHFGSNHERPDVINSLYDIYADEGCTAVYNTGNWIEGESRLNFHDIKIFGLDAQIDHFVQNYPQRKGITTYFIAGDDHEGWYQRKERIVIGKHAELMARAAGRDDLKYIGYVEADVVLRAKHGERIMKVMHPGGGSAYATSYSQQKIVESLQAGEKPSVLLIGHYHKMEFGFPREVFCVQTGCTVDQSIFMRKCKIQAHVGGALIKLNMAPDGQINRFSPEFFHYYDRGYYGKKRNFDLK